ncbi:Conserved_hypothetical protein [Hexamita inflata]|uniref:Transmembrane protein n=1 Tax=Hexamita inflata TaxID=28002 RepID=A0AA86NYM5_9EUKA|nr:Conserved hypothetical protein [Hexamita inflata]
MIQTLYVYSVQLNSQSFVDCFSTQSYIHGDTLANILTLKLIPFESLDLIKDQNMCLNYLVGKIIQVFLHYDDLTFPTTAQPAFFQYVYNVEQDVVFQLTQSEYTHIINKQDAMYELWYDINLVMMNNSVDRIEHTVHNGTGCFNYIKFAYTPNGDAQIISTPNDCYVDFSSLQVYLEYNLNSINYQIPIQPCASNCDPDQYQVSSTNFSQILSYNIQYSQQLQTFYNAFYDYRLIMMTLVLQFTQNGINTYVRQDIQDKWANDVWSCMPNDQANATYWGLYLYTLLNPDGLFIQIRDTLQNIFKCDTSATHHVVLDHYMMEGNVVNHQKQTIDIYTFSQAVGIQFEPNTEYLDFRTNVFVNTSTMSLIVLSFCAEDGTILYEISQYGVVYLGCLAKEILHVYESSFCVDLFVEDIHGCKQQLQHSNERNHASLFYVQHTNFHFLGFFNFNDAMNYSNHKLQIQFDCDHFDPTLDSEGGTCEKNLQILKEKFKSNAKIGFFYDNNFDIVQSSAFVLEFKLNLVPFIAVSCVTLLIMGVGFIIYYSSQRQSV